MTAKRHTVGVVGLGLGRAHIAAFHQHGIETGESPSPSFEDGARAQTVLDAALEPIGGGRRVAVPPQT